MKNEIAIYHLSLTESYAKSAGSHKEFALFQDINEHFQNAVLSHHTGRVIDSSHLSVNEHGKPYLTSNVDGQFHFNKSNTRYEIVIAIAPFELGIDLELKQANYNPLILKKIVHPKDHIIVNSAPDFYKLWTIKEAYIKFLGVGLQLAMRNVVIEEHYDKRYKVSSAGMNADVIEISLSKNHNCFIASAELSTTLLNVISHTESEKLLKCYLTKKEQATKPHQSYDN